MRITSSYHYYYCLSGSLLSHACTALQFTFDEGHRRHSRPSEHMKMEKNNEWAVEVEGNLGMAALKSNALSPEWDVRW